MVVATAILTDMQGKTIGAEFNVDGQIKRYYTEELSRIDEKVENAIIDKNGFVRSKVGELPKLKLNTTPNAIQNAEIKQAKKLIQMQTMTLYHGNKDKEIIPSFGKGKKANDYGKGFYTTPDIELAKEWAWATYTSGDKGYVHGYTIDTAGLKILNLTELDSLHWVAELYAHRNINLLGKEALQDTLNDFVKKYKLDTSEYDIIIGYRADDSYFKYATDFLESAIYRETLDNALRYGNLGLQVFIKSKKAFKRLKKVFIDTVPAVYAKRYKKREYLANQQYEVVKKNQTARKKENIHKFI